MTELRTLELNDNNISELPSEMSRLTKLQKFFLQNNWLASAPTFFSNFVSLKKVPGQKKTFL